MKKIFAFFIGAILCAMCLVSCSLFHQHEFNEWMTVKNPTCVEEGLQERTCAFCGEVESQSLAATGEHNYHAQITIAATCVKDGLKTYTCEICSDAYTESIPATGKHQYMSQITKKETCVADGLRTYTCHICNDTYTEVVEATQEHQYVGKVTQEATCVNDGTKMFTCAICNNSYTQIIKASHTWKNATCTTPKTCSKCNETSGNALGHTTNGTKCSRCGKNTFEKLVFSGNSECVVATGINLPAGSYKITLTSSCTRLDEIKGTEKLCHYWASATLYDNSGKNITYLETQCCYWQYTVNRIFHGPLTNGYIEIRGVYNQPWTITIEAV